MSEIEPETMPKGRAALLNNADLSIENMMQEGEEIVLRGVIHWAIYWKSVAVLVAALLMCLLAVELGLLLGFVGVLMLIHAVVTKHVLAIVLTNRRVIARYGLLQMEVVDVRLKRIESLELERMLSGIMLGYANIVVMGVGMRHIRIPYIANAVQFRRLYNEKIRLK